ncbi:uncharacterized protein LAESUDRAFT_674858 [Laetiporus sulphureus 93-53]|uniref:Probable 26S proteasome regulatory subunit p27 n=1 Tax=Laetiporus sulphureus 93-53 TaxID=1314785 RepID=A0A165FKR8_9APHY|nr:uncharacterized protein LAESUDRAFT_674858 [Laetiporus sulphureus 93-53]KZT09120.1 hypothetical protein LAESUDRAFT_674858 [Laetiporus sulphureus 93-53]
MGMTLPSREDVTPAEQMRTLMTRKENIEVELDAQASVLKANNSTMQSPLVDPEGFPRADIDVWAVRHARVRIIELRNDLAALRDSIMTALQGVYDPSLLKEGPAIVEESVTESILLPFARVSGVAPGSPAAAAGLTREDLILSFGSLTKASFTSSSLQPLAEFVATRENQEISVQVLRAEQETATLSFTPRSGWGGRGLLGCHIVPYTVS